MLRNRYRLNEKFLNRIISENIKSFITERHVLGDKHGNPISKTTGKPIGAEDPIMDAPMPPMGGDPMMGGAEDPNAMGGDMPPMGEEDPMMDDDNGNDPTTNLQSKAGEFAQLINSGDFESKDIKGPFNQIAQAVSKKETPEDLEDAVNILNGKGSDENNEEESQPQMESRKYNSLRLDEILSDILSQDKNDRASERPETKITNQESEYKFEVNPFVAKQY